MKIKRKPVLLFLPSLFMMIITVSMVYHYFLRFSELTGRILEDAYEQHSLISTINTINNDIINVQNEVNIIIDKSSEELWTTLEVYRKHTEIVDALADIARRIEEVSEIRTIEEINFSEVLGEFNDYRANIIMTTDIITIDPERAEYHRSLAKDNYINYSLFISEILKLISKRSNESMREEIASTEYTYKTTISTMLIAITIVFFLAAIIILYMNNYILKLLEIKEQDAKRLKILNDEKSRLIATKDKFFTIISHDLKSPFNTILGFSDLLLEDCKCCKDKENYQYISMINSVGGKTLGLLENLLIWAKSQSDEIKSSPQKINVRGFLESLWSTYKYMAMNKKIEISFLCEPNLEIYCDENMTRTVIRNLITNAIKFTRKNGKICIKAELYKENQEFVKISIEDSGIGISKERLSKLFSIDENISTTGTENEKGTGLGLILCKEFTTKMGGDIFVESEEGKGSCFHITLPSHI